MHSERHWCRTLEVPTGHEGSFSGELRVEVWRASRETLKTRSRDSKSRQFFGEIKRNGKPGGIEGR